MLCTRCGTDVGEKSGLCSNCTAASESTARGSAIGSITPVQRFVHLKPGDPDPRTAPPRQSAAIPPLGADSVPPPRTAVDSPTAPSPRTAVKSSRTHIANFVIAAGLCLLLAALALSFGSSDPEPDKLVPFTAEQLPPIEPDVTPESATSNVPPLGLIAHDGVTSYFEEATAQLDTAKSTVDIKFKFIEHPMGRPGVAVRKEALERIDPQLVLSLRFKKGTTKFDSDALEGYALTFMVNDQSLRVAKTYSKRLASFGEVSQFSGDLKPGGAIRGALRDRRSLEQSGTAVTVEWSLRFDTTIPPHQKDAR